MKNLRKNCWHGHEAKKKFSRDRDAKSKFSGAAMKIGESVSRYGLRLESLFRIAYPGRAQQTSKT